MEFNPMLILIAAVIIAGGVTVWAISAFGPLGALVVPALLGLALLVRKVGQ